jgi:hypothetical protein
MLVIDLEKFASEPTGNCLRLFGVCCNLVFNFTSAGFPFRSLFFFELVDTLVTYEASLPVCSTDCK